MSSVWLRAIASATIILACSFPPASANPAQVDDSRLAWAYGSIVDSVTVTGNKNTRSHAVLREMQTRPGDVLVEATIKRDIRFISDMSPFASVEATAEPLGSGHCALRIRVEERNELFLRLILPFLKYDFETGLTYGLRWSDKNFRGRLENLGLTMTRNERGDEDVSFGWSAPWIGWKHVSVGAAANYYHRGDEPAEIQLIERTGFNTWVGFPLTESRIRFSQITCNLIFDKSLSGGRELEYKKELSFSPQIGYRFDSRDSQVFPTRGGTFFTAVRLTYPLDEGRRTYYRLWNYVRAFHELDENVVLAGLSDFQYQFGDFPDYATVKLGGPGTLRGYPYGRYEGYHRWFGTVECRYKFLPRKVFNFPYVKNFDMGLGVVGFLDSGISWHGADSFTLDHFHGTAGVGLRFYSPIRDVMRLDFGFSAQGDYQFHFGTGIRF